MKASSLSIFGDLIQRDELKDLPIDAVRANTTDYNDKEEQKEEEHRKKKKVVSTYLKYGMPVKISKRPMSVRSITLWLLDNTECVEVIETLDNGFETVKETITLENGWIELLLLYISMEFSLYGDNTILNLSQLGIFNDNIQLVKSIGTRLDSELDSGLEFYKIPGFDWWLMWNSQRYYLGNALLKILKHLKVQEKTLKLKVLTREEYNTIKSSGKTVEESLNTKKTKGKRKKKSEDTDNATIKLMNLSGLQIVSNSDSLKNLIDNETDIIRITGVEIEGNNQEVINTSQAVLAILIYGVEVKGKELLSNLVSKSIKDMCGITKDTDEIDRYYMKIQTVDIPGTPYTLYINNILKYQLQFMNAIANELGVSDKVNITFEQLGFVGTPNDSGESRFDQELEDFETLNHTGEIE